MEFLELVQLAKVRAGIDSDRALGRELGVTSSVVSHWRRGRQLPSAAQIVSLCRLAHTAPESWLLRLSEAKEPEPAKSVYKRLREALATTLAVVFVACGLVAFPPGTEDEQRLIVLPFLYLMRQLAVWAVSRLVHTRRHSSPQPMDATL